MPDLPLKPLQNSWDASQLEAELKALFIKLYDDHLRELADEINVYGAPHLGGIDLLEKVVTSEGLAILRDEDVDKMQYLSKSWRHLNPERGFHFLKTYLRVLFGEGQVVEQLWQKKSLPYPTATKTRAEIESAAEAMADYFLTSRVRVDLDTTLLNERVKNAILTSLAARFVAEVRVAKFAIQQLALAGVCGGTQVFNGNGYAIAPPDNAINTMALAGVCGGAMLFFGYGEGDVSGDGFGALLLDDGGYLLLDDGGRLLLG